MQFNSRYAKSDKDGGGKTFKPPKSVQSAARHALDLIEKGKAGDGFTSVGRCRAHQLANGEAVSMSVIKRMHSYFSRHSVDKKGKDWNNDSPGKVAWLAWGGDAGRAWVNSILKDHCDGDNSKKESSVRYAEAWPSKIDHEKHLIDLEALYEHHVAGEDWHTEQAKELAAQGDNVGANEMHSKARLHMLAADALAQAMDACRKAM